MATGAIGVEAVAAHLATVHRAVTDESIGTFVSKLREDTIERAEFIVTTPAPTG